MDLADLHVHTSDFSDGDLPLAEVFSVAAAKGVSLGIADHVSIYKPWAITNIAQFDAYHTALAAYPVYRSCEIDLGEELPLGTSALSRLDYVIGGLHGVFWRGRRVEFFGPSVPVEDHEAFVDLVIEITAKALRETPVDILGHPTVLPRSMREQSEALWTPGRVERLVYAALESNTAVEINGHARVPSRIVIEACLRLGARLSIGSDGHRAEEIGDLAYPEKMISELGIPADRLYNPERDGSRLRR